MNASASTDQTLNAQPADSGIVVNEDAFKVLEENRLARLNAEGRDKEAAMAIGVPVRAPFDREARPCTTLHGFEVDEVCKVFKVPGDTIGTVPEQHAVDKAQALLKPHDAEAIRAAVLKNAGIADPETVAVSLIAAYRRIHEATDRPAVPPRAEDGPADNFDTQKACELLWSKDLLPDEITLQYFFSKMGISAQQQTHQAVLLAESLLRRGGWQRFRSQDGERTVRWRKPAAAAFPADT